MGWESSDQMPAILRQSDVEVVLGNAEVKKLYQNQLKLFQLCHFKGGSAKPGGIGKF